MVEERVLCTAALECEAFAHQTRISPRPGQHGYGHSKDGMKSKTAEGKNLLSHLPLPCLLGQLCYFHFISLSNINLCVCNSHIVNTGCQQNRSNRCFGFTGKKNEYEQQESLNHTVNIKHFTYVIGRIYSIWNVGRASFYWAWKMGVTCQYGARWLGGGWETKNESWPRWVIIPDW